MNDIYTSALVDMGVSLATLAVKGTATAVNSKSKQYAKKKVLKKYEELMMK